ncbi:MAG: right-handed parallel beta-helix repeat-containing protein [Thermoplasmata archaeon]|nr:MAG: right-handed parallel beta-helix repeat-containing protein [Thermoplasmata archaeon]
MGRKVIAIWLSLTMVLSFIVVLDVIIDFTPPVKGGITRYVNETGSGGAFLKIQDAINASSDGDTVFVYNGTYYENVIVNKTINLTGEDRNNTIINGGDIGDVVNVSANWVNITGFTVTGSDQIWQAGMRLHFVQNCRVYYNNVSKNDYGIYLYFSSKNNIIGNNVFNNLFSGIYLYYSNENFVTSNNANASFNSWYGIHLDYSDGNTITLNNAFNNALAGINLAHSNGNNITRNNANSNNQKGIQIHYYSSGNNITLNNATNNGFYGVYIKDSSKNLIQNNNASSNDEHGIYLMDSVRNDIINNRVSLNKEYGIYLWFSDENNITGNYIHSNKYHGILITDSNGNNIYKNNASNNRYSVFQNTFGIYLSSSDNNNITDNEASNNDNGIAISYSNSNNIISNNASSNRYGIYIYRSSGNNILNNTMIEDGIYIEGSFLENWNTHNIPTSNIVNGKPVYYWKNQTGGTIPAEAGQVILANCTDIKIEKQELFNASVAIELGFSSNNSIIDNNASSNNLYGMFLCYSSKNNITGNNATNNGRSGIYLYYSNENDIIDNDVSLNYLEGIYLYSSSNNSVSDNIVTLNGYGIDLTSIPTKYNKITYNTLLNNHNGIYLSSSSNNTFHHNNIINNVNQAYLSNSIDNIWNDSMGEGNYWDDYNGVDNGNNGRIAGDGVGDTEIPHPFIDQSNGYYQLDNYPLINPLENAIFLYQGWNLISIPFIQSDTNLGTVLNSIKGSYDAVQWFNVSDSFDPWKHNCSLKPTHLNDLNDIDHLMGFWIYITKPGGVLFEYFGIEPILNQTISLHQGWNLVGYPSLTSYNRTEGLNNLTFNTHIDAIWTYNAATQKWEEIGSSDYFEIRKGYWIHTKTKCEWEVPL